MPRPVVLLVAAACLCSSSAVRAGYYMEHETVMPNPVTLKPVRATVHSWHEGRRYKRDNPIRGEVVIIDLDKREVVGINDAKHTYWKITSEKYRQLTMLSLVVMGVMPKADGSVTVPEPLFAKTGQEAVIEGRKAYEVKVTTSIQPGMSTSIWLSKEVPIDIENLVMELRLALGDPKTADYERLFRQWKELEGYPVQNVTTIQTPQGTVQTSETLLTYQERTIPLTEFAVPKGYALTVDPITELEQAQVAAMQAQLGASAGPAGIGAPIGQKPPQPIRAAPAKAPEPPVVHP